MNDFRREGSPMPAGQPLRTATYELMITGLTFLFVTGVVFAEPAPQISAPSAETSAETDGPASESIPAGTAAAGEGTSDAEQRDFFERQIRPLLAEHCYSCHSQRAEKLKAGLRVDSRVALLKGGESGPAVVPGNPDESLLMSALRHEAFEMPPSGKLPASEIAKFETWIARGAWWPNELADQEPATDSQTTTFSAAARKAAHWAWRPLQLPPVPNVDNVEWPANAIDRFILSRLENAGITPNSEASRETLIRRLTFDLTGLPPTISEIDNFLGDSSPGAYERLVDRLMASPQFGEKWARHWLDLVRFAETLGHEFDYPLHHAFQYRDYVIRAWNSDVPYDQFVREHLAGDLLPEPRRDAVQKFNESIIGTGFWWFGEATHSPTDVRADESDRMDNQLSVFGKTFLGLTIACARCHDHKFDPISASDYYALTGFLQSTRRQEAWLDPQRQIESSAAKLANARNSASLLARTELARASRTPEFWSKQILAAARGLHPDGSIDASDPNQADSEEGLDSAIVERLRDEMRNPPNADPDHPFYAWFQCLPEKQLSEFETRWQDFTRNWLEQERAIEQARSDTETFVDFSKNDLSGWHLTGYAIPPMPRIAGQLETFPGSKLQLARPGTIDSGAWSSRLRGALRSPTFTLKHGQIHHFIRSRHAQIRLIVDGYVMNEHNALLFADHMLNDVNTDGEYRWVTQRNDLSQYIGHRAHLEYLDAGDGDFSLASIIFSDKDPPKPPLAAHVGQWVRDRSEKKPSLEWLAGRYGSWISESLRRLGSEDLNLEDTKLINWLIEKRIIEVADTSELDSQQTEMESLEGTITAPISVLAATDGSGENDHLHIRGSTRNLGPEVQRQMLVAISGEQQSAIANGSGRLELANRLLDDSDPFPARIVVNRLWHYLFGRGIVASVDDFGVMGQQPTHPELLDWLATDFRRNDWSLKHSIRQLVTSQTYRMASNRRESEIEERDPTNSLWYRTEVRRLTAEGLHDSLLALSNRLTRTMYGPSIPVYLDDFVNGRGLPASGPLDRDGRRSVYVRIQRNFMSPLLLSFDMPTPFGTVGRRSSSNVPAQSLILMNDPFVWDQAHRWADRIRVSVPETDARLKLAAREAWGRPSTQTEHARLALFLSDQATEYGTNLDDNRVWSDLCHVLLNTKQFLFLY